MVDHQLSDISPVVSNPHVSTTAFCNCSSDKSTDTELKLWSLREGGGCGSSWLQLSWCG